MVKPRVSWLTAALLASLVAAAQAPTPPAPAFTAVSLKPDRDISGVRGLHFSPGGLHGVASLLDLVQMAYGVDSTRIVGAPGWVTAELFQIETRTSARASYAQQANLLRPVLADRFGLTFRWVQANADGYILVVAKGGPKLQPPHPGERSSYREDDSPTSISFTQIALPVAELLPTLEWLVGHKPVLDHTGLAAKYDFTLTCAPPFDFHPHNDSATPPPPTSPSIFAALKDQLGLELHSAKVPVQHFVILAVHRPTPN